MRAFYSSLFPSLVPLFSLSFGLDPPEIYISQIATISHLVRSASLWLIIPPLQSLHILTAGYLYMILRYEFSSLRLAELGNVLHNYYR